MKKIIVLVIAGILFGCAKAGDAFNGTWVSKDGSTAVIDRGLCSTYNAKHELQGSAKLEIIDEKTADWPVSAATFRLILVNNSTLETLIPGSAPFYLHRAS
jgi:hypothetical protein